MPDNNQSNRPNNLVATSDIVIIDLRNPTRARRVIYDGITDDRGNQKSIVIEAGETKKACRIHRAIEQELRERNRIKKDSDLIPIKPESVAA